MAKIYTRKGDTGTTSLIGGERVPKHHERVEAYGTVDELSAHLGLLRAMLTAEHEDYAFLLTIQKCLLELGAILAAPSADRGFDAICAERLEQRIDEISSALPPLREFVISGDNAPSAQAHVCRTVCRRAERHITALSAQPDEAVCKYINRLSDYLFTLARHLAYAATC